MQDASSNKQQAIEPEKNDEGKSQADSEAVEPKPEDIINGDTVEDIVDEQIDEKPPTEGASATQVKIENEEDTVETESKSAPTQEDMDALNDKYMRALAEADNIRRRSKRDLDDAIRFHSNRLVRDLLPVYDNLKRALSSIEGSNNDTQSSVKEGISLTLDEFIKALGKHGVEVIAPEKGDSFDSKLHEALFQKPVSDFEAGKIFSIIREGFSIHGRLLRPAQVCVSSGPEENEPDIKVETAK